MARKVQIDTSNARACAKCGKSGLTLNRHHKGCDGYLGWFNIRIAVEYKKFLDCVDLCLGCHCEIHWLYEKHYLRVWVNKTSGGARKMRSQLISFCSGWLRGEVKKVKVPKKYRKDFTKSFEVWKQAAGWPKNEE